MAGNQPQVQLRSVHVILTSVIRQSRGILLPSNSVHCGVAHDKVKPCLMGYLRVCPKQDARKSLKSLAFTPHTQAVSSDSIAEPNQTDTRLFSLTVDLQPFVSTSSTKHNGRKSFCSNTPFGKISTDATCSLPGSQIPSPSQDAGFLRVCSSAA